MNGQLREALCGSAEIICGLATWFTDKLEELQTQLPTSRTGDTAVFAAQIDPRCHPGAVAWQTPEPVLSWEGKYRVGVHVVMHDSGLSHQTLPLCIWQLAGTNEGRVKNLELHGYGELPHLTPGGWEASQADLSHDRHVYHYTERTGGWAPVRNCAFYASFDAFLSDHVEFAGVLGSMLGGIQKAAFQVNTYAQKLAPWLLPLPAGDEQDR